MCKVEGENIVQTVKKLKLEYADRLDKAFRKLNVTDYEDTSGLSSGSSGSLYAVTK